jgi:transcription termination factor NusA
MATTVPVKSCQIDLGAFRERLAAQFRGLNPNQPGQWPLLPKVVVWTGAALLALLLGWVLVVQGANDALEAERAVEPQLKNEYLAKLAQAGVNTLDDLADLATDELTDITGQSAEEATALIMKAREHWFTT